MDMPVIYNATAPTLASGGQTQMQVDVNGNLKVAAGTPLNVQNGGANYEAVAASQTDQVMGGAGATGDYLGGVLVVPATTSAGAISIKDGAGSAITVFTGGAGSTSNLVPFYIVIGAASTAGAWKITTGANVSAIGFGRFT